MVDAKLFSDQISRSEPDAGGLQVAAILMGPSFC
jgi:hypothetical protein